ncbi:hypothetical protein CEUSTIGMA_g4607.t1 [Chlamydomonas eustigma]|uniref:Sodium/calcium exchanger membrane region domain-containing protein n=1 Tax=Chlamydomonas eustigma TaxID=1157962 RepID=A0A250X2P1_9CHLO|nr:hypothetical protein CEUSTIGMA_g4607.t1 [Chlamydomonas eustigma]|eukprot:GAX77162.1 hypothetical protein CEUSTIGMA_g4607.t1 [Chlamydomonas eustigma]
MALTACIASPLFNMLVSMAVGFWSLLASDADGHEQQQGDIDLNDGVAHIHLTAEVALGCFFLVVYNAVMLGFGLITGALPKRLYLFARVWYGLYFILACFLGFHLLDDLLPAGLRS